MLQAEQEQLLMIGMEMLIQIVELFQLHITMKEIIQLLLLLEIQEGTQIPMIVQMLS
jgi:hypothetical protein